MVLKTTGVGLPQIAWGVGLLMMGTTGCEVRDSDPFTSGTSGATITAGSDNASAGPTGGTAEPTGGTSNDDNDDNSVKLDVLGGDADETSNPLDDSGECASVTESADVGLQPADIIVVVDNSGSMEFEANAVQQSMNALSSQIFLANIDAHVVLLSAYPSSSQGICVPVPLGSGGCPKDDTNLPSFLHLPVSIGSNDALQQILDNWDDYDDVLRSGAAKHIVVVSDDDSDLDAENFDAAFKGLSVDNADYVFHAIAAPQDPVTGCLLETSCCVISAAAGAEYQTLVTDTGGVWGNLCDQDFQPIFDALSTAVIAGATLACEYDIPPAPNGETFDPDEVNVEFDDGMGGLLEIGRVDSATDCAGVSNGWYYDNPDEPTRILVCSQTCDTLQGFSDASVGIKFGCATVPAG